MTAARIEPPFAVGMKLARFVYRPTAPVTAATLLNLHT